MARLLAPPTMLVVFFTIFVATTTELPFWVPLCVLSFNWIGAPLIGSWFEKQNPSLRGQYPETEGFAWKIFALWIVAFALVGGVVTWNSDLPYFTAFAYVLLMGSTALALNSIVIDREDNQKGGRLNP